MHRCYYMHETKDIEQLPRDMIYTHMYEYLMDFVLHSLDYIEPFSYRYIETYT